MIPPDSKDRLQPPPITVHTGKLTLEEKQARHRAIMDSAFAQLRQPLPPVEIARLENTIRQKSMALGELTPEREAEIKRATQASHNLSILEKFRQLKDGLPRRLAELNGNDIRHQMGVAAGQVVEPNSTFGLLISKAVERSVAKDAARPLDTVKLRGIKPEES
jgi:hypothetical protein